MLVVAITAVIFGTPCSTGDAFRKHGASRPPPLALACAIEHAAVQLQEWPPTPPSDYARPTPPSAVIVCF